MPTNKELIEDILKIQPDVNTNDLNKTQLTALLSDLQAAHALSTPGDDANPDLEVVTPPQPEPTAAQLYVASRQPEISKMAEGAMNILNTLTDLKHGASETVSPTPDPEPEDDTDPEVETQPKAFTVVEGKSITSRRGLLKSGREISADDLAGGQESLNWLISKGYIK